MYQTSETAEEIALRRLWRNRFQQDVPVSDHGDMLTGILLEYGVSRDMIEAAIAEAREDMD